MPRTNMQNKSQHLCVLFGSVGKCQFVLQSFTLRRNYNSCSGGDDASAFACAPPQSQRSPLYERTQNNILASFKPLLLLELQLREWRLNEHDRCCMSAVMVVFQCAADHNLRWVIPQTSCSICCQAPLVFPITYDKVMVKWAQLALA